MTTLLELLLNVWQCTTLLEVVLVYQGADQTRWALWSFPLGSLGCARLSLADLVDWEVSTM